MIDYSNKRTEADVDHDQHKFAVGMKYDLKTRNLTMKKLRYIWDEIMTDLKWSKRKSMEFQLALFYIFFLFFFRIFTHYIGQYICCMVLGVPVTEFTPRIYKITMEYASFTFYQDFMIVISGVLANTITFTICFILAFFSKKVMNCFPRVYYKIIGWIGVWTILDPIFVLITDLIARDWQHGDWFEFYKFFARKEKA